MKPHHLMRLGMALLLAFASNAWASADLTLRGSNTIGATLGPSLVKAWLKAKGYTQFEEKSGKDSLALVAKNAKGEQYVVDFETLGSSTAFKALLAGTADIGMASRRIKPSEDDALRRAGSCGEDCESVIGLDGIAIIVNPANPLARLDKSVLRKVFDGEVTDWSQIGGKAGKVHVYSLDNNSGTFDTFHHLVLGDASLVTSAKRFVEHTTVAASVLADPNGIGFVGMPYVGKTKALLVSDGEARPMAPSAFTVATEDYVLARRLYFYPAGKSKPAVEELIRFINSQAGQSIVEHDGFVSQNIVTGKPEIDASMPEEYRTLTADAVRLSVNFRFEKGAAKLDSKADVDVKRLVDFMGQPAHKGKDLMLFGFADGQEIPFRALELSTERADQVADILAEHRVHAVKTRGYGSAVPVASNATEEGRHHNRRVEVWMR